MKTKTEQKTKKTIGDGKFYPLGATLTSDGVNFALFSENATQVTLYLFDPKNPDGEPTDVICIENKTRNIWHCFVKGIQVGQPYAYKVNGPFHPESGQRFNPNKLLIDPYAKAFTKKFVNEGNNLIAYDPKSPYKDLTKNESDNTKIVPKCLVVDDRFDWENDVSPEIPFEEMIVYETHVKGFTAHNSSKAKSAGTYLGFAEKAAYLKELGVNAVELLPVHEYFVDDFLVEKGLTNYWGYNTIGFFAPEMSYSSLSSPGCAVTEFKTMVKELHKAGIEVILDVVYNHTAEGNEMGPTMCFKGIDNKSYYILTGDRKSTGRFYMNYTGCGNSVNLAHPAVIRMVLDSLRYWTQEMHVDGFRFDLASVLGREAGLFEKSASFFDAISQDPTLCRVKLIAEPWDLGTYQVGQFPVEWAEWNGRFRDTIRKFAKGDRGQLTEMGFRLTGSADLYGDDGRHAYNSVNFVTCHDGFTMYDLVAYNGKHNEANLENNNDGNNDNASWNCGWEGESTDNAVIQLRKQQVKNLCCYLMFSLGVPMILGGDEFLRTQKGNNNAYCQDNEMSWLNWDEAKKNKDIVDFFRKAIAFRKTHSIFHRKRFFSGQDTNRNKIADIAWFDVNLNSLNWFDESCLTFGILYDGSEDKHINNAYFIYLIFNADYSLQFAKLPKGPEGKDWKRVIDTSLKSGEDFNEESEIVIRDQYIVNPRSVVMLMAK